MQKRKTHICSNCKTKLPTYNAKSTCVAYQLHNNIGVHDTLLNLLMILIPLYCIALNTISFHNIIKRNYASDAFIQLGISIGAILPISI